MEKGKTSRHYRGPEPRPSTSAAITTELYVTENRMYCRELVDIAASRRKNREVESLLHDVGVFCAVLSYDFCNLSNHKSLTKRYKKTDAQFCESLFARKLPWHRMVKYHAVSHIHV